MYTLIWLVYRAATTTKSMIGGGGGGGGGVWAEQRDVGVGEKLTLGVGGGWGGVTCVIPVMMSSSAPSFPSRTWGFTCLFFSSAMKSMGGIFWFMGDCRRCGERGSMVSKVQVQTHAHEPWLRSTLLICPHYLLRHCFFYSHCLNDWVHKWRQRLWSKLKRLFECDHCFPTIDTY